MEDLKALLVIIASVEQWWEAWLVSWQILLYISVVSLVDVIFVDFETDQVACFIDWEIFHAYLYALHSLEGVNDVMTVQELEWRVVHESSVPSDQQNLILFDLESTDKLGR